MKFLNKQEYQAIAKNLMLPTAAYFDGGHRPAQSGATFHTINPADGTVISDVASCGAASLSKRRAKRLTMADGHA